MLAVPALALAGNLAHGSCVDYCRTNRTGNQEAFRGSNDFVRRQRDRTCWVFGLNEALDQCGATVGPLIVALVCI